MDGNNQPQQPFQPAPGPAPQPVMPPQPVSPQPQPIQPQPPSGGPTDPMNPAGSVGAASQPPMGAPYQMPPKKGLSKGALWGIIGGSVAFILLIVGVVLAVVFLGEPSKEDYLAFQSQVKDIKERRKKMNDAMEPYLRDVLDNKKSDGSLRAVTKEYSEGVVKLESMKAGINEEVKKAYQELKSEHDATKTYVDALLEIEGPLIKAGEKCDRTTSHITNLRSRTSTARQYVRECMEQFDILANSKAEKVAAYGKRQKAMYGKIIAALDDMIKAIDNRNRDDFVAAQNNLASAASQYDTSVLFLVDIVSETKKHRDMPKLNALEDVVAEKLKK
ncbi:MAG: hypothetical protein Q4A34_03225 [Candidatus Saccharibacteria bacterium]|nr:hypothetical protein [Candidatus Saccharibacteria bacterium]